MSSAATHTKVSVTPERLLTYKLVCAIDAKRTSIGRNHRVVSFRSAYSVLAIRLDGTDLGSNGLLELLDAFKDVLVGTD